jgi:hypothetical protein
MPVEIHPERTVELTTLDKDERSRLRSIVGWILAASLIGGCALYAVKAHAGPILRAQAEGITVTIYEEACQLKEVTNLPKRATWTEKGKTFEGCIGAHPQFPVLMAYFTDKTVVVLPVEMFTRVVGA